MKAIILAIALLTSLATRAIADPMCAGDKYDQGYCQITSVETNNSADITRMTSDCKGICGIVADHAGDWKVVLTGNKTATLIEVNYCSLRIARGINQANPLAFRVAKQDILDLVDGAITFSNATGDQWISLKGNMTCDGKDVRWWVN
ncbi:hypothetical protein G7054_g1988 [Neopestalotiopsis clavispora]|nr:hypothetical protein G7054_g1988 [Neopestalotiopsis clavispora]